MLYPLKNQATDMLKWDFWIILSTSGFALSWQYEYFFVVVFISFMYIMSLYLPCEVVTL